MKNFKIIFVVIVSFIFGVSAANFFFKKDQPNQEQQKLSEEEGNVHYKGEEVHVNEKYQQLLNVEMFEVKKAPLIKKIDVTGQIAQDVENISNVLAPGAGIMTECRTQVGAFVKKDDVVCLIKDEGNGVLTEVKSPRSGVIIADFHKVGDKVDTVSEIHTVADISRLWANFDIYEKDVAQVKLSQKILVHSIAYLDIEFEGEIVFISPRVDEISRTIKIRALIKNSENLLKLGMFVNGQIVSKSDDEYLTVPASAVQTMGDKMVVFVKIDEGKFRPQEVYVKAETADQVALSDGIKEGDSIVSKGAFLLKSALLADQLEEE